MKTKSIRLLLLLVIPAMVCSSCADDAGWTALLDNELSSWDSYLSYRHKVGYNGQQPVDGEGNLLEPVGLNKDGYDVFTVTEEENEPLLKVSGEIYGCLISKEEYENYHLRLKVKWGTKKWDPRKNLLMDSGILYHSIGEPGIDYWRSWMLSQEFQIMEGHMGDFWSIANSAIDIKAYIPEGIINPVADISQDFISVGSGEDISGFCLRSASYENPHGEWNTLELICHEGKSIHMVNGNVVMVLMNSRFMDNGRSKAMNRGKIQIQSEAAEVYFKNIEIRPMETLPAEYLQYFQ